MNALVILAFSSWAAAAGLDIPKLDAALGASSQTSGDEVKYSFPHPELGVTVDKWRIVPPMGLTSWVAFTPHEGGAMAMGDLVLLEGEVKPVQAAALKAGLDVTALHNHFLRDTPKVMYMHVGGMGPQEKIAKAVRAVLDAQHEARASYKPATLAPDVIPVELAIDTQSVSGKLGYPGTVNGSIFKIVVGRQDVALRDMGAHVSSFLGFNSWLAFQGGSKRAAVAGDFAMREREVAGVIRALVGHGIEVAAIHNHMVAEEPRIVFLHFWGVGPVDDLVTGLKAAMNENTDRRQQP